MQLTALLDTDWDQLTQRVMTPERAVVPAQPEDGRRRHVPVEACETDLEGRTRWSRWQQLETDLAEVADVEHLRALVWSCATQPANTTPPARQDVSNDLMGALLRLANVDVHDDPVAAQLVGLLMTPGCWKLVGRLNRRRVTDSHHRVAAALWEVVRTAPLSGWRRYASNLMWAVRRQVETEAGWRVPVGSDGMDDPELAWLADAGPAGQGQVPGPDEGHNRAVASEQEWADLLAWAAETESVDTATLKVLVDLVAAGHDLVEAGQDCPALPDLARVVADQWGVSARSIRRHRLSAVRALQAALGLYQNDQQPDDQQPDDQQPDDQQPDDQLPDDASPTGTRPSPRITTGTGTAPAAALRRRPSPQVQDHATLTPAGCGLRGRRSAPGAAVMRQKTARRRPPARVGSRGAASPASALVARRRRATTYRRQSGPHGPLPAAEVQHADVDQFADVGRVTRGWRSGPASRGPPRPGRGAPRPGSVGRSTPG